MVVAAVSEIQQDTLVGRLVVVEVVAAIHETHGLADPNCVSKSESIWNVFDVEDIFLICLASAKGKKSY